MLFNESARQVANVVDFIAVGGAVDEATYLISPHHLARIGASSLPLPPAGGGAQGALLASLARYLGPLYASPSSRGAHSGVSVLPLLLAGGLIFTELAAQRKPIRAEAPKEGQKMGMRTRTRSRRAVWFLLAGALA